MLDISYNFANAFAQAIEVHNPNSFLIATQVRKDTHQLLLRLTEVVDWYQNEERYSISIYNKVPETFTFRMEHTSVWCRIGGVPWLNEPIGEWNKYVLSPLSHKYKKGTYGMGV